MIDREIFFDRVRTNPFPGSLNQEQVDGMSFILATWEDGYEEQDLRWLAYALATAMWETSSTMQPIEEYGKGSGQPYGARDPETGQQYYGRGFVQLTWRENYSRADKELDLTDDESCEWFAANALDPDVAAAVMFLGMIEGWFRSSGGVPNTLAKYFNEGRDDPFEAREIINGDKNVIPPWSAGMSIGNLIADYHQGFLAALKAAYSEDRPRPEPPPPVVTTTRFILEIRAEGPVEVTLRPV